MIFPWDATLITGLATPATGIRLQHNLPLTDVDFFVVQLINRLQPEATVFVNSTELQFPLSAIQPGRPYKMIVVGARNGLIAGVWWADQYVYDPAQAQIMFTSRTDTQSGTAGTFSGSVQINGQGVSRSVLGIALDADPPYLLAQTQSAANGSYTLEWQGYSGQLLVTALDDYGQPFTPGMTLGVGDRVHPSAPNGFVYQSGSIGITGSEPAWPTTDGDTVTSGEVQLVAVPFWRPKSSGPFSV